MLTIEGKIVSPVRSNPPKADVHAIGHGTSNGVSVDGVLRKRIEIGEDGFINKVGEPTGAADIVLTDEFVFPGFIDLHVHARECVDHSWDYKEDFTTAGEAAINGGIVAFADMPNNPTPPVDNKTYADKYELAKKSAVDVLLYAGIGPKTNPLAKNVPYKVFTGPSIGDLFFKNDGELESVLLKYSSQNISFHCEDPEVLEKYKNQPTHELRRPAEAEVKAVEFVLELIKKYQLKGKICHISTVEGLQKIVSAKKAGLSVAVEVTPHHLYFDDSAIASVAKQSKSKDKIASSAALLAMARMFQVNPPIRQTKANRLALIAALKNGDIDFLATDHAPHTIAEKQKGMSGMPHMDTYGPFTAWLMKEHNFTPQEIARVCSVNPGRFFSQFAGTKYGQIKEGFVGSLTVMDMAHPITIQKSMLKTKCGWSPFEGVEFPGRVVYTIIKGKIFQV